MTPTLDTQFRPRLLRHLAQSDRPQTWEQLLLIAPTQPDADQLLDEVLAAFVRCRWVVTLPPRQRVDQPRYAVTAEGVLAVIRHLRRTDRKPGQPSGNSSGRFTARKEGGGR